MHTRTYLHHETASTKVHGEELRQRCVAHVVLGAERLTRLRWYTSGTGERIGGACGVGFTLPYEPSLDGGTPLKL